MKDYISSDFVPTPRNRQVQKVLDEISFSNFQASQENSIREYQTKLSQTSKPSNSITKLYCGMCESGELKRTKQGCKVEGLGVDVVIPRYSCKVCGSSFSGYGTNLKNESNPSVTAIVSVWDPNA